MNSISQTPLKFSCPHCGQHFSGEAAWVGRQIACPVCKKELLVPGVPVEVPSASLPEDEPEPWWQRRWAKAFGLLGLGAASPFMVLLAMAFSAVTGPLVLVVAPVVGFVVARMACGYVYENPGPRWFIYYVSVTVAIWLVLLWQLFWPSPARGGAHSDAGALVQGLSGLMVVAAAIIWLLAALWTWLRSVQSP